MKSKCLGNGTLLRKKEDIEADGTSTSLSGPKKSVTTEALSAVIKYPVIYDSKLEPSVEEVEEALASMPIGKALGAAGMIFLQKEL